MSIAYFLITSTKDLLAYTLFASLCLLTSWQLGLQLPTAITPWLCQLLALNFLRLVLLPAIISLVITAMTGLVLAPNQAIYLGLRGKLQWLVLLTSLTVFFPAIALIALPLGTLPLLLSAHIDSGAARAPWLKPIKLINLVTVVALPLLPLCHTLSQALSLTTFCLLSPFLLTLTSPLLGTLATFGVFACACLIIATPPLPRLNHTRQPRGRPEAAFPDGGGTMPASPPGSPGLALSVDSVSPRIR